MKGITTCVVPGMAARVDDHTMVITFWVAEHVAHHTRPPPPTFICEAYEQLAMYHEHRAREPQRALEVTREALAELRRAHRLGTIAGAAYRQEGPTE